MLVLSRATGESIMLGDTLRVTVMAVEPTRCRLQVSRTTWPIAAHNEILSDSWLEVDEQLPLGPGISCMVVKILEGKMRLGVIAPRSTSVLRQEIYEAFRHPKTDAPD